MFPFHQVKFYFRQCVVNGKTKQHWHQWVTLFTPFFLVDSVPLAVCILPRIRCGGTVRLSHEWQEMAQTGDFQQFRHHRSTVWSYAPIPSTDNTVVILFASVAALTAWPTQSTPARVERANWNGVQAASTSVLN